MKLDRLIAKHRSLGRKEAHRLIAAGRVRVNSKVITDNGCETTRFDQVKLADELGSVQAGQKRHYILLHKPAGVVSATKDREHTTVLDLLELPEKEELHVAGRLDRASTGLVLLTNDGCWSKHITQAVTKVPKTYRVQTDCEPPAEAEKAFAEGFYFPAEEITTLPASLIRLGACAVLITLHEGRHHQIKRMLGRLGCMVTQLHRVSIGGLNLPPDLLPGQWRHLTEEEKALAELSQPHALIGALFQEYSSRLPR